MDYKKAGVDVEKGDLFVEKISGFIRDTYDGRVVSGVGGFAALYAIDDERLLASGTDGVGTKVKLAQELGIHDTIGQDLVAMCVNDVLCTGARPLFFLDYFATGKLDLAVSTAVVRGVAKACKEAQVALIGGETAEMPGVYSEGVYDLAGFAVGELRRSEWIDGKSAAPGQTLIGIRSSGFHSNGYSLVRALLKPQDTSDFKKELLTPTRLYTQVVLRLLREQHNNITGIAHITGGGIQNIPRINDQLGYEIHSWAPTDDLPPSMKVIVDRAQLSNAAALETFNMGIGMVFLVKDADKALSSLIAMSENPVILGQTVLGSGIRLR